MQALAVTAGVLGNNSADLSTFVSEHYQIQAHCYVQVNTIIALY